MAGKLKPGQYRHRPSRAAGDGRGRIPAAAGRRRVPYTGLVFLLHGAAGPLACAGAAALVRAAGITPPSRFASGAAPTLDNVLFGAGAAELVLACAVPGWLLWRLLWRVPLPEGDRLRGFAGAVPALVGRGLLMGPLLALSGIPIAAFGLYVRTAPADQPLPVRLLLAAPSTPFTTVSALLTGSIPCVVVLLGAALGVLTALAVACLWQRFPEEPLS